MDYLDELRRSIQADPENKEFKERFLSELARSRVKSRFTCPYCSCSDWSDTYRDREIYLYKDNYKDNPENSGNGFPFGDRIHFERFVFHCNVCGYEFSSLKRIEEEIQDEQIGIDNSVYEAEASAWMPQNVLRHLSDQDREYYQEHSERFFSELPDCSWESSAGLTYSLTPEVEMNLSIGRVRDDPPTEERFTSDFPSRIYALIEEISSLSEQEIAYLRSMDKLNRVRQTPYRISSYPVNESEIAFITYISGHLKNTYEPYFETHRETITRCEEIFARGYHIELQEIEQRARRRTRRGGQGFLREAPYRRRGQRLNELTTEEAESPHDEESPR